MSDPSFRRPTWIVMVKPMWPLIYEPRLIVGSLCSEPIKFGPTFKNVDEANTWIVEHHTCDEGYQIYLTKNV